MRWATYRNLQGLAGNPVRWVIARRVDECTRCQVPIGIGEPMMLLPSDSALCAHHGEAVAPMPARVRGPGYGHWCDA